MEERDRELLNWITEEFKAPVDSRAEQALTDLAAFMGYEPDGKGGWNKHG
jgi:succinate dehydrogenase flavin-adding protein (antitoxin of CptAB toxin-antitoxin module)